MPTPTHGGRDSTLCYINDERSVVLHRQWRRAATKTPYERVKKVEMSLAFLAFNDPSSGFHEYGKSNKLLISPDVGKLFIAGDVHFLARFTALRQVVIA